jgi:DNA-binding MurR/RpiR family transcriptional regulator
MNPVRQKIADYLLAHPEESYQSVARKLNCSLSAIANIAREAGIVRLRKPLSLEDVSKLEG